MKKLAIAFTLALALVGPTQANEKFAALPECKAYLASIIAMIRDFATDPKARESAGGRELLS